MTKGAWIAEDVSRHFRACPQCREVHVEEIRVQQPEVLRRSVPDEVIASMCPDGRSIYRSYLRWLAEPDW